MNPKKRKFLIRAGLLKTDVETVTEKILEVETKVEPQPVVEEVTIEPQSVVEKAVVVPKSKKVKKVVESE